MFTRKPSTGPFSTARGLSPLIVVCVFLFAFPIVMLAVGAVRNQDPSLPANWGWNGFRTAYTDPATYSTLRNSLLLSTAVTVLGTGIGLLCAFLVTRTRTPLRRLVTPCMLIVVALPPLFYAISWGMLGNPRIGAINTLFRDLTGTEATPFDVNSWTGLIVVIALKSAGFSYLMLLGPFLALDRSLEEAAQISGASKLRTMLGIDLPVLAPAVSGVVILNFVIGLEFFDVPLFLGTPAGIEVFSTRIYGLISESTPADYGGASALSLLLVAVVMVLVGLQWRLLGRRSYTTVTGKGYRTDAWDIGAWRWAGTAFIVLYALLAVVAPMAQLVIGSLQPFFGGSAGYSLVNYRELLADPTTVLALRSTLFVAVVGGLGAMLLALVVGYAIGHNRTRLRRVVEMLTWLPWAVPGVVLSLGIAWAYISVPGLRQLYGTVWIVLLALIAATVPIAQRAIQPALAQLSHELEEASRVAGARPLRMFAGIVFPLIAPSFLAGWFVSAIVVSGNLAVPILLSSQNNATVPLLVFELYTAGETSRAAALFVIMMVLLCLGLVVLAGLARLLGHLRRRALAVPAPHPVTRSAPATLG
ncbi:ABC transporter permease [Plantactinospora solaniradicis]|uniref:ABC transporter permease n=1 Tax=Plantactinospora solaniradicis TaxID=1723736 RepID=A0ABW1KBZ1_9ACTN